MTATPEGRLRRPSPPAGTTRRMTSRSNRFRVIALGALFFSVMFGLVAFGGTSAFASAATTPPPQCGVIFQPDDFNQVPTVGVPYKVDWSASPNNPSDTLVLTASWSNAVVPNVGTAELTSTTAGPVTYTLTGTIGGQSCGGASLVDVTWVPASSQSSSTSQSGSSSSSNTGTSTGTGTTTSSSSGSSSSFGSASGTTSGTGSTATSTSKVVTTSKAVNGKTSNAQATSTSQAGAGSIGDNNSNNSSSLANTGVSQRTSVLQALLAVLAIVIGLAITLAARRRHYRPATATPNQGTANRRSYGPRLKPQRGKYRR